MAVSQISKGVYIVSPDVQKRYQDTAAGEYTSVFTKSRANLWEMSKQQALMNIQEDSARYKAEMALYSSRIADMDKRAADLEAAKADYLAGRTTADAALQKAAMAEATDRQKTAARYEQAKAERFGLSAGATSVSTGAIGGGARGGAGAATGKVQEFETATRGQPRSEKLAALKEIGGPGGILADLSPAERATTQFEILDRQHARDAADLELSGLSAAEADVKAAADLVDELQKTDPAMARAYESRGTSVPAGVGGAPSVSTRVDRGQISAPRYPGMGALPPVEVIKAELSPSEAAEFDKSIAKIAEERALLGLPPKLPPSDYITVARRIAAGRIPGLVGGGGAPFEQQLRFDALLNASPEDRDALKAAFIASRAAPAVAPTTPVAAAAPAEPAVTPPPVVPTAPMATPMTPPAPPLRFTGAFASPEAEAFLQEVGLPVTARTAALRAPSAPPRLGFEDVLSQRSVSGGATGTEAPLSDRMRLSGMALQPPGYAVPVAEERTQYIPPLDLDERGNVAAPRAATAGETLPMIAGRPSGPLAGETPEDIKRGTANLIAGAKTAESVRKVSKLLPGVSVRGVVDGGPPTALYYFQKRYEAANDLAQKPDKLSRLTASGVGKVVQAIYTTNAKTNVPFETGWQEIALQYSNDMEKMKGAHELLLALDLANKNTLKPKE